MTGVLLVPGRNAPLPDHWLERWNRERSDCRWVRHRERAGYDLTDRVAALDAAVNGSAGPVVLVGHSAGCITVASWAQSHSGSVRGALLVTPPDLDRWFDSAPGPRIEMPKTRLPFPSVLVASRDDPTMSYDRAVVCAADWGAELVDAGPVGHLNTAAGFGPWPAGEALLGRLLSAG